MNTFSHSRRRSGITAGLALFLGPALFVAGGVGSYYPFQGASGTLAGNGIAPRYAVIDLGTNMTYPMKVTSGGYVLDYNHSTGTNYVWYNGTNIALQPSTSGDYPQATDIDDNGRVVGIGTTVVDVWPPGGTTPSTILPTFQSHGSCAGPLFGYHNIGTGGYFNLPLGGNTLLVSPNNIWTSMVISIQPGFNPVPGFAYFTDMFQMLNGGSATELGSLTATWVLGNPPPVETLSGARVTVLAANSSNQALLENDSNFQQYNIPDGGGYESNWHPSTTTYTVGGNTVPFSPYLPNEGIYASYPAHLLSNVALGKSYVLGSDAQISWSANGIGGAIFTTPGNYYCWDGTTKYTLPQPSGVLVPPQSVNAATANIGTTNIVTVAATQIIGNYGTNSYLWEMPATTNTVKTFNAPVPVNNLLPPNSGWSVGSTTSINDRGAIVGTATYSGTDPAYVAGTNGVMVVPAELAVDADRNGTIVLANENPSGTDPNGNPVDQTTQAKPFQFWVNNDQDNGAPNSDTTPYASEVVPAMPGTPNEGPVPDVASRDCDSNAIVSMRDLEDWTRLWIYTKGLNQAIHDAHILVGLKWKQVTRGIPGIKIVKATDSDGGTEYLTDSTFAAASAQATNGGTSPRPLIRDEASSSYIISASASSDPNRTADFVFPSTTWTNLTEAAPKTFFLFEGASEGEGELEIVFLNADTGAKIGEGGCLWLDLRDIKEMYEREMSMPVPNKPYNYSLSPPPVSIGPVPDRSNPNGNSGTFVPDPTESSTHTYIVFVHGYNMTIAGSTNYAETMFKRLWWRGYKGRFAAFRWNTYGNGTVWGLGGAIGTYNDSEFVAWHSGTALKTYVNSLPGGYTVDVVSHSLGSVVVGEAIEEGMSPAHYSLLHAAASASCYSTPSQPYPTTNFSLNGSPDTSTDPATYALAYRYAFEDINSTHPVVNFYDDKDDVIGIDWEANNYAFKPQPIGGPTSGTYYYYHSGNLSGQKLGFETEDILWRSLSDFGEARAYADFSLTQTIGSYDTTSAYGAISSGVDENLTFGFGNHHSPEFNLSIQQLEPFYNALIHSFLLTPNP